MVKVENFSEAFYKPDGLYQAGMLDHIFRGMVKTHTQSEDLFIKAEMTNKMFMDKKTGFGLDLVNINLKLRGEIHQAVQSQLSIRGIFLLKK
jgi:hypothetical protein